MPGLETSAEITHNIGTSTSHIKEIKTTLGIVVSGDLKAEKKDTVSAALSAKLTWQREEMEKQQITTEEYLKKTVTYKLSKDSVCRVVAWQPRDYFTLYNYDDELVKQWSVYGKTINWSQFPE